MITVTITRFGGVAGIPRTWLLELEPDEWDALSARGGDRPDARGRDRFVYRISAEEQVFEIPESRWDDSCRSLLAKAEPVRPQRASATKQAGPTEEPEPNRRDGSAEGSGFPA
ncbi:MAG TPA: hypothetical protein VIL55_13495 [Naasia sp.]